MARIIIEDRSEYAKTQHGTLYWAGDAWNASSANARVYSDVAAAQRVLDGFDARRAAYYAGLGLRNPGPGYVAAFVDLDKLQARCRLWGGTFRAALSQGVERAAAKVIADAAVAAAGLENVDAL